jgi:hypothetical protein
MVSYLLNGVLILWVLIKSVKQKKVIFAVSAAIILFYAIFSILQNSYSLVEHSHLFGWIQKMLLVVLTGCWIMNFVKSPDKKNQIASVVFAVIACVSRFVRTYTFDLYTGKMQMPGADFPALYQELYRFHTIMNSVTRFALVLMLFIMAFQLGKPKNTPCNE